MIRVGILGATGYTGFELVKILSRHSNVEITVATSEKYAGQTMSDVFPAAPELRLVGSDSTKLSSVDVACICLPHAAAAPKVAEILKAGTRVVDLSADYRLRDPVTYSQWY